MRKQLLGLCVSYTFGKSEQQVHLQPLCFIVVRKQLLGC